MSRSRASELYRSYACRCVEISYKAPDSENKLALLNMAQAWLALAEQADKNSKIELVYETPEQPQRVVQQQQQPQDGDGGE
jgi:hypothetical protein